MKRSALVAFVAIAAIATLSAQRGRGAAPPAAPTSEAAATLKDAANALGMLRQANRMDAINTMEFWGTGTSNALGQQYHADGPWPVFKTEWHATLSYAESAMRVDMVRNNPDGPGPIQGGGFLPLAAPQTVITVVAGKYAWNESEIGAGLVQGKGVATPAIGTTQERQLQLWTLPYGAIKAAIAAGDKAKVSMENGATVVTFPLAGELAGLTAKMTLDDKKRPVKVEAKLDNPVLGDMLNEVAYSDYALKFRPTSGFPDTSSRSRVAFRCLTSRSRRAIRTTPTKSSRCPMRLPAHGHKHRPLRRWTSRRWRTASTS
jgi:hypothetical protein